jgi:protein involved in polysaccharide export with SLBB domain
MTLFVPAYNQRVTLEGQVKRPGIFEMKPGDFSDLLSFASGFNEFAYTASVNVRKRLKIQSARYQGI